MIKIVELRGLLMQVDYSMEADHVTINTMYLINRQLQPVGNDVADLLDSLYFMYNDSTAQPALGIVVDQLLKESHGYIH